VDCVVWFLGSRVAVDTVVVGGEWNEREREAGGWWVYVGRRGRQGGCNNEVSGPCAASEGSSGFARSQAIAL
jgi:hypothetical protein